jgi:hypothetical protein
MNTRTLVLAAALAAFPAAAQVQISVQLPTITFAAPPPLIVVQPGVQVVEDNDEEVFFVDNYYWVRRGPHWYRARDHRGGWVVAEGPNVPATIVRLPPGQYRHYKHAVKQEFKEERREEKHGKHGKH